MTMTSTSSSPEMNKHNSTVKRTWPEVNVYLTLTGETNHVCVCVYVPYSIISYIWTRFEAYPRMASLAWDWEMCWRVVTLMVVYGGVVKYISYSGGAPPPHHQHYQDGRRLSIRLCKPIEMYIWKQAKSSLYQLDSTHRSRQSGSRNKLQFKQSVRLVIWAMVRV